MLKGIDRRLPRVQIYCRHAHGDDGTMPAVEGVVHRWYLLPRSAPFPKVR